MNAFTYYCPTEVVFGKKTENKIAKYIYKHGGTRVLFVYGKTSSRKSGLLDRIGKDMEEEEIPFLLFGGAMPNPTICHVRRGIEMARAFGADMIIGVGGGSAIDTAKAIAHGVANGEWDVWEFFAGRQRLKRSIPIGAILTLPASGSEMSDSAVLSNEEEGCKLGFSSELNRPKFAILNPELTLTLTKFQVGCGIADILMHTLERYLVDGQNIVTQAIAEALLRTVIQQGRIAIENPLHYEVMSELMWASSISQSGLTGLGGKGDWACHQLGHELSAEYDLAHGTSLTVIWESWARYVYRKNISCFERFAQNVWRIKKSGEEAALEAIKDTVAFLKEIKMPVTLKEVGLELNDEILWLMAQRCCGRGKIGVLLELEQEDIFQIYKAAANNT